MKTIKIAFAFVAFWLLSGGQCVFIANSGSGSSSDNDQRSNLVVIIRDGQLVDGPTDRCRRCSSTHADIVTKSGTDKKVDERGFSI